MKPSAAIFVFSLLSVAQSGSDATKTQPASLNVDGLHNVFRLTGRLYSGDGPDGDTAFATLKKLGIQTIVSVDGAKPDLERARKFGMRYVHVPIGYSGIPHEKTMLLAKTLQVMSGPIYIHCHHGKHRGPAAAAIAWLCLEAGPTPKDALAFLRVAGTDPRYAGLFKSVEHFRRASKEELLEIPEKLPEAVHATGLTQSMVALDHAFDNLKLARAASWKMPKDHPDIDPAHEALLLVEGYRESQRLPDVGKRPHDFQKWLDDGHNGAKELELLLRKKDGINLEQVEAAFRRAARICSQCHTKYRDMP